MIGIVIPAHNEEDYLDACIAAVDRAAADPALQGEPVQLLVVLDSCDDASAAIVARHAARRPPADKCACAIAAIAVDARNVGVARALGAQWMLDRGARWLAFTDADTRVSPGWLAAQLSLDADVVCGTVAVDDWSPHADDAEALQRHFADSYTDADGHRHIHGANMGVSAHAYRKAGGFAPLACSEDVALVEALQACGARFAWSAAPRVSTSARRDAKARGGFGDTLLRYATAARLAMTTPGQRAAGPV